MPLPRRARRNRESPIRGRHTPEAFRYTHGDERKDRRVKHRAGTLGDNRLAELFVAMQVR